MAQLQDALDHAAAGEARAVRVVAEAGCGKSRLVREFTTDHLPDDWRLCQAEALPHRRPASPIRAAGRPATCPRLTSRAPTPCCGPCCCPAPTCPRSSAS